MLDDKDLDLSEQPQPGPPKRSGGRSFIRVAGLLGALMLLSLVGLAFYALVILPQQQAAAPEGPSSIQLTNTAVAHALQTTSTSTPTATRTSTRTPTSRATPRPPTATNTPLTPLFTVTGSPTVNSASQTVSSLLTQAALAQTQAAATAGPTATGGPTETPSVTASALPQSGFGDSSDAPLLLGMAVFLLMVIFAARRLRSA